MAGSNVYFISDMHLGARYLQDARLNERRVAAFLASIADDASDLYIMGDAIDYWFEYRTVVPRGYVRFFGALAALADKGVRIHWFTGNHDIWMLDYIEKEIGVEIVREKRVEEILGQRFFLSHGDDVGRRPLGYRILRGILHNKVCRMLYASVHPRWTVSLAHASSKKSRNYEHYQPREWRGVESEPIAAFASDYLKNVDPTINYFIFGHHHMVVDEKLSQTCRLLVLGEWIHLFSYAKFDGKSVKILYYTDQTL